GLTPEWAELSNRSRSLVMTSGYCSTETARTQRRLFSASKNSLAVHPEFYDFDPNGIQELEIRYCNVWQVLYHTLLRLLPTSKLGVGSVNGRFDRLRSGRHGFSCWFQSADHSQFTAEPQAFTAKSQDLSTDNLLYCFVFLLDGNDRDQ